MVAVCLVQRNQHLLDVAYNPFILKEKQYCFKLPFDLPNGLQTWTGNTNFKLDPIEEISRDQFMPNSRALEILLEIKGCKQRNLFGRTLD